MTPHVRTAEPDDVTSLVELMKEFYDAAGYSIGADDAAATFTPLLQDESLGRVWVIEADGKVAGYVVLTLGYSMEYGGRDAFVDDLFVRPAYRRMGLGKAALDAVFAAASQLGVQAVHLEVDRANAAAKELYHKFGFQDNARQLLTVRLGDRRDAG